ncbi:MAG: 5'-methylthioadenosine/adenosylhomocysteine nucleosidase [Burkholderiaceae bacterium]
MPKVAIVSAMQGELSALLELMPKGRKTVHGGREFWQGRLHGHEVVMVLSRLGKVAAATTATILAERLGVQHVVFTGLAGGLGSGIRVGDVVVADAFIQHDMDVSPLYPQFEVPLYEKACFRTDAEMTQKLVSASQHVLADPKAVLGADAVVAFDLGNNRVHLGLVATGDRFITSAQESHAIQTALGAHGLDALAVEMEGAAFAQVCFDYGIPFAAVRTISDHADHAAHVDFKRFLRRVASRYSAAIIEHYLN